MGQGRFLVMAWTTTGVKARGTCFESGGGTYLVIRRAQTFDQALAIAAGAGPGAEAYAVRPDWSLPASRWVAADSDSWGSGTATP
jgi:hypothetical protein